ncbi:hypothetical protein COLO4_01980 [Corchorus olitorius]|uniref:Uncharacterized protein n=1 Tax=Corchorus olitorius TaxID=93759 RepID=A0A1R3L1P3_9ROSI|nr:hypothetical protein COLO4_01980 [Corchorus olitorius]
MVMRERNIQAPVFVRTDPSTDVNSKHLLKNRDVDEIIIIDPATSDRINYWEPKECNNAISDLEKKMIIEDIRSEFVAVVPCQLRSERRHSAGTLSRRSSPLLGVPRPSVLLVRT